MARKPLVGTVEANWLAYGTGALNINASRILVEGEERAEISGKGAIPARHNVNEPRKSAPPAEAHPCGRWPANVIHDGSRDVLDVFPESHGQQGAVRGDEPSSPFRNCFGNMTRSVASVPRNDAGSAARFFYCGKARREDRNDGCDALPVKGAGMVSNTSGQHITRRDGGAPAPTPNNHPTVKPTDLMRYLCRLVTPAGGTVLDPFAGSGSTGRGAIAEGFQFVGIELDPEYAAIAEARIKAMQPGFSFGSAA